MIFTFVEGHGEVESVHNLLNRLWLDLRLELIPFCKPMRWTGIYSDKGLEKACEFIRLNDDAKAGIILFDEDDNCPITVIKHKVEIVKNANINKPIGIVLIYREYESILLASIDSLKGKELSGPNNIKRPGIRIDAKIDRNIDTIRDAKGYISNLYENRNRTYKPTLDQLQLTRLVDFSLVRKSKLPCFGTLERCLTNISINLGKHFVYPILQ